MELRAGRPWFAPKRFGFGATPVTWEGWCATLGFAALMILDATAVRGPVRWVLFAVLTVAFVILAFMKSSAGWRWRWGDR